MAEPTRPTREQVEQAIADLAKSLGATSYWVCGGPGSWDECLHEHQDRWEERIVEVRDEDEPWDYSRWWCPICNVWRT